MYLGTSSCIRLPCLYICADTVARWRKHVHSYTGFRKGAEGAKHFVRSTAQVKGDEEHGSEEAKIGVTHPDFEARTVSFRVHFPVPSSTELSVMLANNTLRSYTGYYDGNDKSCNVG